MKKEIKVGDYIRGFKSECDSAILYEYIGQIAEVINIWPYAVQVKFSDGLMCHYQRDEAIEHLVTDFNTLSKIINDMPKSNVPFDYEMYCKQDTKDNINPSHYKKLPKETIERIQDNLTPDEFKGYLKGNIYKYMDRYENKNGVEDLNKAQWYLRKILSIS
jgi:hypothetical protein